MELTCLLVKPDGVSDGHIGEIVARMESEGFIIRGLRLLVLTQAQAGAFYAIHHGRPFFEDLVEYMTGGPIVACALEREDAVSHLRTVIGATDPAEAAERTASVRRSSFSLSGNWRNREHPCKFRGSD